MSLKYRACDTVVNLKKKKGSLINSKLRVSRQSDRAQKARKSLPLKRPPNVFAVRKFRTTMCKMMQLFRPIEIRPNNED